MKVAEVARRLDASPSLVYKLIGDGKLKAHRINSAVRVSEQQLDDYLAAAETQGESDAAHGLRFF